MNCSFNILEDWNRFEPLSEQYLIKSFDNFFVWNYIYQKFKLILFFEIRELTIGYIIPRANLFFYVINTFEEKLLKFALLSDWLHICLEQALVFLPEILHFFF